MDTEQKKRIAKIIHASEGAEICPTIDANLCALIDDQDSEHGNITYDMVNAMRIADTNKLVITKADLKKIYIGLAAGLQLAYEQAPWTDSPNLFLGNKPPQINEKFAFIKMQPKDTLMLSLHGVLEALVRIRDNYTDTTPMHGISVTPELYPLVVGIEEGRHVAQHYNSELKTKLEGEEKTAYPNGRPVTITREQYKDDPHEKDAATFVSENKEKIIALSKALIDDRGRSIKP